MSQTRNLEGTSRVTVLAAIMLGAVVSLALGVYGRVHQPSGQAIATLGFGNLTAMKVWLAVAVGVLAMLQLLTALWLYGRLGVRVPGGLGLVHRGLGTLTILVSLPVAYHCLWSLGFATYDSRVLAHSLLGCLVYGAFVTKVVAVQSSRAPGLLLPLAGGVLFVVVVGTVLTSAAWYLATSGLPSGSGAGY